MPEDRRHRPGEPPPGGRRPARPWPPPWPGNRRITLAIGLPLAVLLGLALLELGLRRFGLGHPPLLVADRQMEYRFRPDQRLNRFGHPIRINQWGMRSLPFGPGPAPGKRRLLLLGDSVLWGGAETDQERIAVSRLQRQLGSGWELLNLATPSWGPANWLGAVRHFGLLGAPQVLLVISSHDADDDPTFAPLEGNPETPTHDPPLALIELWQRYLAPRLGRLFPGSAPPQSAARSPNLAAASGGPATSPFSPGANSLAAHSPAAASPLASPAAKSSVTNSPAATNPGATSRRPPELLPPLPSLDALVTAVRSRGGQLVALQHWERGEVEHDRPYPGHDRNRAVLERRGVPITQAGPILRRCAAAHGQPVAALYVDQVHPYTNLGQICLAEALRQAITPLSPSPGAAPSRP